MNSSTYFLVFFSYTNGSKQEEGEEEDEENLGHDEYVCIIFLFVCRKVEEKTLLFIDRYRGKRPKEKAIDIEFGIWNRKGVAT